MLSRLMFASMLVAMSGLCAADDKKDEKKKEDKDLIQGEWVVEESTIQKQIGKKLILKGEEWTSPGGQKYTFKIDASKDPKQLDLTFANNTNATFLGIYKLDDDKLTFCREKTSGAGRPKEFKSTPKHDLLVLKRPESPGSPGKKK